MDRNAQKAEWARGKWFDGRDPTKCKLCGEQADYLGCDTALNALHYLYRQWGYFCTPCLIGHIIDRIVALSRDLGQLRELVPQTTDTREASDG